MEVKKTNLPGLVIIKPKVFEDKRGYFFESYNKKALSNNGINFNFVQDNESKSSYGVIRGLHYQIEPYAQTKLIRVLEGCIYDVVVDIRQHSPTFAQWFGTEINAQNKIQLLIPKGFAHGFSVLSKTAILFYKCDTFYNPSSERGIIFNDKTLQIDWKIKPGNEIVSEKDMNHPTFDKAKYFNF